MSLYWLPVTCGQCAGPVDLVNTTAGESWSVGIMECPPCNRQWEVHVTLRPHQDPDRQRATNRRSMARARAAARMPDTANV